MKIQLTQKREFPRCSVVDTPCFQTAEGLGLVPGWETEIPADHVVPGWGGGVGRDGEQKKDREEEKPESINGKQTARW